MKHTLLFSLLPLFGLAQSPVGPNSPTIGSNAAGTGTLTWSAPGNIISSNDTYSAVSAASATSQYVQGSAFGFSLLNTDVVSGIRLEVEKSVTANPVTLQGSWTVGTTRPPLAAGINRCLIVMIGLENSLTRNVTSVSYGGLPMTQIDEAGLATPFYAETSCWYLLESDLALAAGTAITYTEAGSAASENFEIVASALYINVDQASPFFSSQTNNTTSSAAAYTFTPNWAIGPGSVSVYGLFCGAPFNSTSGAVNSFSINNGYTKHVDQNNFSAGYTSSGGVLMVADKTHTNVAAGMETNTTSTFFNNSSNRRTIIVINLRRARNFDNSVRLTKAGSILGNDYAQTTTEWSTVDAYSAYGGINDAWGTGWSYTDINDPGFGAVVSATLNNNGDVRVDHMRITVFKTSVLPLELISFTASLRGHTIPVNWITASEHEMKEFAVEKSTDGIVFNRIGSLPAAGNSTDILHYELIDGSPDIGINYYRLKMTNNDGTIRFSDITGIEYKANAGFTVYPNPASDWVTVLSESKADEIFITDAHGKIVDHVEGNDLNSSHELNLYGQPDGTYYICFKTGGETKVQQLVKLTK